MEIILIYVAACMGLAVIAYIGFTLHHYFGPERTRRWIRDNEERESDLTWDEVVVDE